MKERELSSDFKRIVRRLGIEIDTESFHYVALRSQNPIRDIARLTEEVARRCKYQDDLYYEIINVLHSVMPMEDFKGTRLIVLDKFTWE